MTLFWYTVFWWKRWMQLYFISTTKLLQCCIFPLAHLQFKVYLFILNKFLWMQLRVTHLVWGVRDKGINFLFFLPWGYKLACRLLFIGTPQSADNKQSSYSCTPLGSRQSDSQKNTHPWKVQAIYDQNKDLWNFSVVEHCLTLELN